MKRISVMLLAAVAAVMMGRLFPRTDIEELEPVQVIYIRQAQGNLLIETDLGHTGAGQDLEEAVADLKRSASATVFLDTADFLILDTDRTVRLCDAAEFLRPGIRVCLTDGISDLQAAGKFLSVHGSPVTLARVQSGERNIPKLKCVGGRMEVE